MRDDPRRARFDALALPSKAEVHLGRGGEQSARHDAGQIPIEFGGCVWHAGLMLDGEGEKWMRSAGRGPRIFVGAEEPDGVCGEARRLGGAGDENGRVLGLRREESFVHGAVEDNEEIAPRNTPRPSKPSDAQSSTVCCQRRRS